MFGLETITDEMVQAATQDSAADRERIMEAMASQVLAGKQRPCVVIISDGAAGQVRKLSESDETVVHWPVGRSDDNLGITRLRVRPHRQQSAHHAYLSVVSALSQPVETQVVFELDGSTAAVEPLAIDAGGSWEKTVVFNTPAGGVLRAWIDRPDALAADNEAYAILEPIELVSVLLVTPPQEAFFFEQALLAMHSLVDPETSLTLSVEEYDALDAGGAAPDVTLFNNSLPRKLPASGQFVFVNGWTAEVPAKVVGTLSVWRST
jgi:hypothetical protein